MHKYFGYSGQLPNFSSLKTTPSRMTYSKRVLVPGIFLLFALILTYWNHFSNPFHFDDEHTIVTNTAIRDIGNIPRFFKDATTTSSLPTNQAYRPGLTALNAIDHWIGGKDHPDPFYFHLSIFISYVILGFLLFFLILHIFDKASPHRWNPWFAWFATGLFWLHTANAETINYIIARSDSFSTLMVVLSFVIYIYKPKWRLYQVHLIPMVIGFFVKEPTLMYPPLLFFYILFFEKEAALSDVTQWSKFRSFFLGALVKVIPALIIAIVLFLISRALTPPNWTSGGGDWFSYMITQTFVIVHYFNNFILPVNLSADTDWTLIYRVWDDRVLAGTGFILLMLALTFYTSRKKEWRPVAFGILWFFIALLPTSSVFPFAEVLNDHRPFFPYIGLVIAASWTIARLAASHEQKIVRSRPLSLLLVAGCMLLLAGHAAGTRHRNNIWSTGESLWRDVTLKSPGNARGWMNYGNALMAKGLYDDALKCYLKAKEIWPYYSYVYINLAILKGEMGIVKEAEENFKLALQYGPYNPEAYYYYARWLNKNGRTAEATALAQKGLEVSPGHLNLQALMGEIQSATLIQGSKLDNAIAKASNEPTPENYLNLSLEFYLAEKYDKSIEAAKEALKLKPDYADAYNNICSAYNMLGEYAEAEKACKKALEIKPDYELAKNNLAQSKLLASQMAQLLETVKSKPTPEGYLNLSVVYYNKKQYQKCIDAAREALKLKPDYADAYNNICSAYNMLKQWDNAIEACRKALEIDPGFELAKNNLKEALRMKEASANK
jgi:protein O-mannosyl-transferase